MQCAGAVRAPVCRVADEHCGKTLVEEEVRPDSETDCYRCADRNKHCTIQVDITTSWLSEHSPDDVKLPNISLTVHGTPAHVKCYSYHASTSVSVSGGGRNATVHRPKQKWNAQTQQSQEWMQLTINSFRQFFPDKIFSLTFSKIPHISQTAFKFTDILSNYVDPVQCATAMLNWPHQLSVPHGTNNKNFK